jgi:hypothetical protein
VFYIKIPLPDLPQQNPTEVFQVGLSTQDNSCKLGPICQRDVEIVNDIFPPTIEMKVKHSQVDQTKKTLRILIIRKNQKRGSFVIPWRLQQEDNFDSPYNSIKGELTMEGGKDEMELLVDIPQIPLPTDEDKVDFILEEPVGILMANYTTSKYTFVVKNSIGANKVEMLCDAMTCNGDDNEVAIVVRRPQQSPFPAAVAWVAEDGDAKYGEHYAVKQGQKEKGVEIQMNLGPSKNSRVKTFRVNFFQKYLSAPRLVEAEIQGEKRWPDTFKANILTMDNTGFDVEVERTDVSEKSKGWGQTPRIFIKMDLTLAGILRGFRFP